jgi:hypothetical protein
MKKAALLKILVMVQLAVGVIAADRGACARRNRSLEAAIPKSHLLKPTPHLP